MQVRGNCGTRFEGKRRSLSGLAAIGLLLGGLLAGAAQASQPALPEGCSEWQLLPDFTCEGREGRDANSVMPMGMPYLFEDPHTISGLNFAYVYHQFPGDSVFAGGDAHVLALQARLALTDRLSFIATKDGLMFFRPDLPLVEEVEEGMDITAGFKYALINSPEHDFILSPAIRYEVPVGSKRIYQGYGDGVLIPSASFAYGFGDLGLPNLNLIGSFGAQLPIDGNANSTSLFYNAHLDYFIELGDRSFVRGIVPFVELNAMHWTDGGNGQNTVVLKGADVTVGGATALLVGDAFEGADVANLGASGVGKQDLVVLGGGLRMPLRHGISLGALYETPISKREDIFEQRVTFMATWEF